jgi:hypothetical protein
MQIKKSVRFYADKKNAYVNKQFCFYIESEKDMFRLLLKFKCNGNSFRSIYDVSVIYNGQTVLTVSIENIAYYNFFSSYDTAHYPSLLEAWRDYEIWLHDNY